MGQNAGDARYVAVEIKDDPADFKAMSAPSEKSFSPGWIKDSAGSVVHTIALSQWLDPAAIASSAVDLNIKLMKWREIHG